MPCGFLTNRLVSTPHTFSFVTEILPLLVKSWLALSTSSFASISNAQVLSISGMLLYLRERDEPIVPSYIGFALVPLLLCQEVIILRTVRKRIRSAHAAALTSATR
ncbi:uncharacterized protein BDR25DRAFT_362165 [Lindgomyces ingoldianus]|uniref:Uncharacterized protein n=1 Tax=Lindgomyces ingoldianus TaxID=673940 RepID=A0ACB6QAN3_9PLEO|nr:uncharacterized protein BDR25DRAFT_362165 [Lindgomyces ingoldianus]KAF2463967.1 hypothetical protein BDR25DRAFT_362165 [Lindgomyces ingoldianus]